MNKPLVSFLALLISIAFVYFMVRPAYLRMQDHRVDKASLEDTLKKIDTVRAIIEDTSASLAGVSEAEKKRFEVFLPDDFDEIRFANNLQRIGATKGIVLSNIKVESPTPSLEMSLAGKAGFSRGVENTFSLGRPVPGGQAITASGQSVESKKYQNIKASFSFTAPYSTFLLLLDSIEKSLGLINITSLSLTPVRTESSTRHRSPVVEQFQFTVDIETYALK